MTDSGSTQKVKQGLASRLVSWAGPLVALIGAIILAIVLRPPTDMGVLTRTGALRVEQVKLEPGRIDIVARNTSLSDVTIAQVTVNNAVWTSLVFPEPTVAGLRRASIQVAFEWREGQAYEIVIYTSNTPPVTAHITTTSARPQISTGNVLNLALSGLFLGILPIYLGLLWLPLLSQTGERWAVFVLALSVSVFFIQAVGMLADAWRLSNTELSLFWTGGLGLMGMAGGFWLIFTLSRAQKRAGEHPFRSIRLANTSALGIGLFSLGEGILLGQIYLTGVSGSIGGLALLGIMLPNISKGFGLGLPALYYRLGLGQWLVMGFVGGFLAIAGLWLGRFGLSLSATLLLLGLSAGAMLAVIYRLAGLLRHRADPAMVVSGLATGLILLSLARFLIG